jgi:hypothetical protein
MATRNLYDTKSVAATLLYAVQTANRSLLSATVHELIASDESTLAHRLLTIGWLLSPPTPESRHCYDAWMTNDVLTLLSAVSTIPPYELPQQEPPPPSPTSTSKAIPKWPPNFTPAHWSTAQKATFERAYTRSKKNPEHAAWLLSQLEMPHITAILKHTGINTNLLEIPELKYRSLLHLFNALSVKEMVYPSVKFQETPGRSFKIITAACDTWNVSPHPKIQLLGIPLQVLEPTATQYWKTLVQKYRISSSKNAFCAVSDDDLETFYTVAFPCDIPDEWSATERGKSHPQWNYAPLRNDWTCVVAHGF